MSKWVQSYFWVYLWGCFQMRLAFKSCVDLVDYPSRRGSEWAPPNLQAFKLGLNGTPGFPEFSACRKIAECFSFHNHTSQFFIVNLFLHIGSVFCRTLTNTVLICFFLPFWWSTFSTVNNIFLFIQRSHILLFN